MGSTLESTTYTVNVQETPSHGEAVAFHTAENCTSLRCPLHHWTSDLNGNLVMDADSVPSGQSFRKRGIT